MKIPRYNYLAQFADLPATADQIRGALASGDYILGETVIRFEQRFADYLGAAHAIGVNTGTDALTLALIALGLGSGDEVVTVANTFHATALAIAAVGATPVLVDCEPDTYLMDLDALDAACGPDTRAILAVHLFGRSLDMDRITTIAARHQIPVVEDCAQAVGATWAGRRVGTFGAAAAFSFHPSKNLAAAGDAGAVVTDNPEIAHTIRVLRGLGQHGQGNHVALGVNSKLDAIQAIVLDAKLDLLDGWNAQRRTLAARYTRTLTHPAITVPPPIQDPGDHVYHLYQVAVPHRDAVLARLRSDGIDAVIRYPVPVHRQPAFARYRFDGTYPHADHQAADTLCLPIRPDLSPADVDFVCARLTTAITDSQEALA
ncbi:MULTISPECIES: DegT/DnrJ/EryC1/StrS family aminotransferase [Nocardia]|uniref:Aminotransferase n=1 Tax=Nocardia asteroides NBRC 15531 TaxID=1110697 RepID=U5EPQ5_NOCAS|nr:MULTISPECIES: DegT/DnrJ/EryC1/StrS family aminotransferase [Nocardia]TLF63362.1 DegT/DnrJ/EryC1/StrS family aminotransferase [Nocardia asteroides NBRC 15531]UGT47212.1 DegT/DnrJ/EryC1/StrS family aminotransferase [Nocardia asteroides]SFM76176.1 dTDP-4-amino-4,6-dideoxygalactose transaminase [Nocardia asteroides]VEG33904.1 UDP-4-amino-4-deoxy-L-arabinose--oxoglutarate aminotransferase [Nocardia asteroides]GAD87064.1 putative aminotransferase [Nocardia asteroides NBRC 15531]